MGVSRRRGSSKVTAAFGVIVLCTGMIVAAATPAAAATVVVNQNHEHGWHMQHTVGCDGGENTGDQRFVVGPQGAPGQEGDNPEAPVDGDTPNGGPPGPSAGSLEFSIGENGNTLELFRNVDYDGVALDAITGMTYWTYVDAQSAEDPQGLPLLGYIPAVFITLHVDTNDDGVADNTLTFEPAYQFESETSTADQHDVDPAAWQKWIADDSDTDAPEGKWYLGSDDTVANMKSLDAWQDTDTADTWTIQNVGGYGGVVLGAGCGDPEPWEDFLGNTDRFTIDVQTAPATTESTTYDFEPGSPADATVLDCEPEQDENPTGTDHTITCNATNSEGVPIPGAEIDMELTGANDPDNNGNKTQPDYTCETDEEGNCTFVHGPDGEPPVATDDHGVTLYTAWIDVDGQNSSVEADPNENRDETTAQGEGDDREPDGTDVVEKTWIERTAAEGGVDAEPEGDTNELGENHTIEATVYDQFGDQLPGDTMVNFEFFQGSPSDTDGNTPETPDKQCDTSDTSKCSITYSQTTQTGTDLICVFTGGSPGMSGNNTNGTCGGEGKGDADDDTSQADPPSPAGDDQDIVSKTWEQPVASRLDCFPETASPPTGSAHKLHCAATSTKGNPAPNTIIDAEITGANDPDGGNSLQSPEMTCTTRADGLCTMTHGPSGTGTSSTAGVTTYRSWIDLRNDSASEADQTEGRDETATPGTKPEPDNTDVTEATWQLSPLECEPESTTGPAGTNYSIACSAESGTQIDVEMTGANDPDDADSPGTPDLTCTTGANDTCTMSLTAGNTTEAGVTVFRAWGDADGSDTTTEADAGEGQNEATAPGNVAESDITDVLERTWTQEAITQCNDGTDNDNDGATDHPQDPGCDSETDNDETDPRVTCPGFESDARNQVVGTSASERLVGTSDDDIICGLDGHDTLAGLGGNDLVLGAAGDDILRGRAGDDDMRGGLGGDTVSGGSGSDQLRGNKGADEIDGGSGVDECAGGPGKDMLRQCE